MDKKQKYLKPVNITLNTLIAKYFSNYIDYLLQEIIKELKLDEKNNNKIKIHINAIKHKLITENTLHKLYS